MHNKRYSRWVPQNYNIQTISLNYNPIGSQSWSSPFKWLCTSCGSSAIFFQAAWTLHADFEAVVRNSRGESNSSLVDALSNMANAAQIFNKDFLGILSKKKNSCLIEGIQNYLSFRHFYFPSRASWTRTHWRLQQYSDTRGDVLGSGIQSSLSMKPGLMILLKLRMRYKDSLRINSVIPIMSPCLSLIYIPNNSMLSTVQISNLLKPVTASEVLYAVEGVLDIMRWKKQVASLHS